MPTTFPPISIFDSNATTLSARNTNVYNFCKRHKAIFSVFHSISQPTTVVILSGLASPTI